MTNLTENIEEVKKKKKSMYIDDEIWMQYMTFAQSNKPTNQ